MRMFFVGCGVEVLISVHESGFDVSGLLWLFMWFGDLWDRIYPSWILCSIVKNYRFNV